MKLIHALIRHAVTALIAGIALILIFTAPAVAQVDVNNLSNMSIEDLLNIEVTSVNRSAVKLSDSAAAIYVITQDDIRRSGLTSVAELLRMVPGMEVAQINGSNYAISARGFNSRFSTKLLVLIDGRSVYTPLYAGVWWDAQDMALEDIERIEVIRGPGAAMWGANAVNGIINIITKRPEDAQEVSVSALAGTLDKSNYSVRSGGKLSENGFYRVYGKRATQDGYVDSTGEDAVNEWGTVRGGFRCEWKTSDSSSFTLQGDAYNGKGMQPVVLKLISAPYVQPVDGAYSFAGANLMTRWNRLSASGVENNLQLYYDRTFRSDLQHWELRETYDMDFQSHLPSKGRHEWIWGLGYRNSASHAASTTLTHYTPGPETTTIASAFLQDQITLKPDLALIVGSKWEHNTYTGLEVQPNVRMLWTPPKKGTFWGAVSRAVRSPGRLEDSGWAMFASRPGMGGLAQWITLNGQKDYESEELMAYELGYRTPATNNFSLDISAFYNVYHKMRTFELGTPYLDPSPVPHFVVPLNLGNKMDGQTNGVEVAANWKPKPNWKLSLGYTYLNVNTQLWPSSQAFLVPEGYDRNFPKNQVQLRSYLDLPRGQELDMSVYYVEKFEHHDIPGYMRLDARYGWRLKNGMDISIVGQNLLDKHHTEFYSVINESPLDVPRSFYLKIEQRW